MTFHGEKQNFSRHWPEFQKLCLLLHFTAVWYLLEAEHFYHPKQLQIVYFHRLDKRRRPASYDFMVRVFSVAESFTLHYLAISHCTTLRL